MYLPFDSLPPDAHIWIYQADRPFTASESDFLCTELRSLCNQWAAHGEPLKTSFTLEHNQFVVLAVDEKHLGASGCSIDGSVRILKELERKAALNFFDRKWVAFLQNDQVVLHPLAALATLFENKTLSGDVITFDNTLTSKADWKSRWKTQVRESWLARYLPKTVVPG